MTALLMMIALGCAKDPAPAETPAADNPTIEAPAEDKSTDKPGDKAGDNGRTRGDGAGPGDKPGGDAGKPAPPNFGGNVDVSGDPKGSFEKYRDRLEGQEAAGECAADSECAPAGCSQEVCVPAGAEITTTCEVLPVYTILDTCGCVETKCQWSLKE